MTRRMSNYLDYLIWFWVLVSHVCMYLCLLLYGPAFCLSFLSLAITADPIQWVLYACGGCNKSGRACFIRAVLVEKAPAPKLYSSATHLLTSASKISAQQLSGSSCKALFLCCHPHVPSDSYQFLQ